MPNTPHQALGERRAADALGEDNRLYAIRSLLRAEEEFGRGEWLPLSALDAMDAELGEAAGWGSPV